MTTYMYKHTAVGVSCGVLLAVGGGIVVIVVVFVVIRKTAICEKRYVLYINGCYYQQSYIVFPLSVHTCKPTSTVRVNVLYIWELTWSICN